MLGERFLVLPKRSLADKLQLSVMCRRSQLNPRYCEQLRTLLSWPQSCGVLGGRPSSSLLFVGAQGSHVLFMDPHEVQEVRLFRHRAGHRQCILTGLCQDALRMSFFERRAGKAQPQKLCVLPLTPGMSQERRVPGQHAVRTCA